MRDPLAAFDSTHIVAVAAETGVSEDRLRESLRAHQRQVRELPGVDDIVYEWRRAFPHDPVVERREEAYYLLVESSVWPEFVEALGLSERMATAVRDVHRRQVAENAESAREPMVLTRP